MIILETDFLDGSPLSTSRGRSEELFKLTSKGRAGEVLNVDYPDDDTMLWWNCWMWPVRNDDDRIIGVVQGCHAHQAPTPRSLRPTPDWAPLKDIA